MEKKSPAGIVSDTNIISEILSRGVEGLIEREHLEVALRQGKKLRVKLGIDPTSKNIHIGRAVALWKLRDLQDLGHKIVFIVGDFTGLIGDSSDKDSERPMLTPKQVKENLKGYIAQVGKILDIKKVEVHYNSKWLGKLGFLEIAEQADLFSLHEFIAREMVAKRIKDGKRVSLRELLYPLMQGYDSVAVKADIEVGGTDQRFNLLAGRVMQRHYGQKPQDIMTFTLLEGTDGRKMSSSWGNVINITDPPKEMFGKTMSIADSLIVKYLTLCTRLPLTQIKQIEKDMQTGSLNPRYAKATLAQELVRMYHGEKAAAKAVLEFDQIFKSKEVPQDRIKLKLAGKEIVAVIIAADPKTSSSQARRIIDQGGVKIDGVVSKAKEYKVVVQPGSIIQIGKRTFVEII